MKTKLLVAFILFLNVCNSQHRPSLQSFGEPFTKSNIVDLHIVQPRMATDGSGNCEKIALLIDVGEVGSGNSQNFQVLFATLNGQCDRINVKSITGTDVTINLGEPTVSTYGIDGKVYVGTTAGHVIQIDVQRKNAVDWGMPPGVFGKITALSLGTDLSICGLGKGINALKAGVLFKYEYGCNFGSIAYNSQNTNYNFSAYILTNYTAFTDVVSIGTDKNYTYVTMGNPLGQSVLFAVNNSTNLVQAVNVPFHNSSSSTVVDWHFYVENYAEDRVLVKAGGIYYEVVTSSNPFTASPTSLSIGKRIAGTIWKADLFQSTASIVTSYSDDSFILGFDDNNGYSGTTDLSSCVRKIRKPITAIAPYIDGKGKKIFMHGDIAMKAALFNTSTLAMQQLGVNKVRAQGAITNMHDFSEVYIGGYDKDFSSPTFDRTLIQKFSSATSWQQNTNPADLFDLVSNTNYSMNWLHVMKMLKNSNMIAVAGVNNPSNETRLTIVDLNNNSVNPVTHSLFSQYILLNKSMDVDQINDLIVIAGNEVIQNSYDRPSQLMAFHTDGSPAFNFSITDINGNRLNNVSSVLVDRSSNLYVVSGGALFVITDYINVGYGNPVSVAAELIYDNASGMRAVALFPNMDFIAVTAVSPSGGIKVHVVDIKSRDLSYPNNLGNTVIVDGEIPDTDGTIPTEFAFVDERCYLAGFNNLWGFDYSSIPTPILVDFDQYDVQRTAAGKQNNNLNAISIDESQAVKVFPNPAKSTIKVAFTADKSQSSSIDIFDAKGKLVLTKKVTMVSGKNTFEVNIQNLPAGMYVLKLTNSFGSLTKRFLKQ